MAVPNPVFDPNQVDETVGKLRRRFNSDVPQPISLEEITPENRSLVVEGKPGRFLYNLMHLHWNGNKEGK